MNNEHVHGEVHLCVLVVDGHLPLVEQVDLALGNLVLDQIKFVLQLVMSVQIAKNKVNQIHMSVMFSSNGTKNQIFLPVVNFVGVSPDLGQLILVLLGLQQTSLQLGVFVLLLLQNVTQIRI